MLGCVTDYFSVSRIILQKLDMLINTAKRIPKNMKFFNSSDMLSTKLWKENEYEMQWQKQVLIVFIYKAYLDAETRGIGALGPLY